MRLYSVFELQKDAGSILVIMKLSMCNLKSFNIDKNM